MGLLDRSLPGEGRRGVTVAAAVGVVALLAAALLAGLTLGGGDGDSAATPPTGNEPVTVVSRAGGFSVRVPGDLTGTRNGRSVQVATPDKTLLINVGPRPASLARRRPGVRPACGEAGLPAGSRRAGYGDPDGWAAGSPVRGHPGP